MLLTHLVPIPSASAYPASQVGVHLASGTQASQLLAVLREFVQSPTPPLAGGVDASQKEAQPCFNHPATHVVFPVVLTLHVG